MSFQTIDLYRLAADRLRSIGAPRLPHETVLAVAKAILYGGPIEHDDMVRNIVMHTDPTYRAIRDAIDEKEERDQLAIDAHSDAAYAAGYVGVERDAPEDRGVPIAFDFEEDDSFGDPIDFDEAGE